MANSQTSGAGLFGFALQSGKAAAVSATGNHVYIPVLSAGIGADQRVSPLPQEVGGSLWQRGSYKQSVVVGGDVSLNVRPKYLGYLIYALCGSYGTAASGGELSDAGMRSHRFAPNMTPGSDLPWLTLVRHLPQGPSEQYEDCVVRNLRIEAPSNSVINASIGFAGITPVEIPTLTPSQVSSKLENLAPFVSCSGSVTLTNSGDNAPATRISLDITNELSMDEFVIGSYYLDDITLLSRTLSVSFDTFVRDAALYRAVMRGDAAAAAPTNNGAGSGAWSPTIVQGALTVLLKTVGNAASGGAGSPANPAQLKLWIPSMDFLTFPISVAGNNLVRSTLSGQVTLVPTTNDGTGTVALTTAAIASIQLPFVIELANGESTNYSAAMN